MSLADVLARTRLVGFNSSQEAVITGVITQDYNTSTVARAMFEGWIVNPSHYINIKNVPGVYQAYTDGSGRLEIDFNYIGDLSYITDRGEAVLHSPLSA